MQHAVAPDVGDELAAADDEAPVLAHAAAAGDEFEAGTHPAGSAAPTLDPASRRAASSIASTICA